MVTQLKPIKYPESDGQPMADNTLQYRWIVAIQGGIDALFKDEPNIFVAGDLLWYPVEGNNKIRVAPDVLASKVRVTIWEGLSKLTVNTSSNRELKLSPPQG